MMARAHPTLALRPYLPADASLLAEIFRASVEELTEEDYEPAQQEAWASLADDEEAFAVRLGKHLALIATLDGSPVGFISLDNPTDIGLFYVHPAAAGQGVGTMLYDAIEFFQRRGFEPQQRNSIAVGDEWLSNTTMKKKLAAKGAVS